MYCSSSQTNLNVERAELKCVSAVEILRNFDYFTFRISSLETLLEELNECFRFVKYFERYLRVSFTNRTDCINASTFVYRQKIALINANLWFHCVLFKFGTM